MGCGDSTAPELTYIWIQCKLLVPADAPFSNVLSLFLWGVGELWSSRLTRVACLPVKPTRCGICNTAPKAPCPAELSFSYFFSKETLSQEACIKLSVGL